MALIISVFFLFLFLILQETDYNEIDSEVSSCSETDIVSFYKDDLTTPYYEKGVTSYSGPELLDILVLNVDDARVSINRPLAVQENAIFVIKRTCLKSPDDWLQDDHGSFENKGHSGLIVTSDEDGVFTERLPRRKQERPLLEQGQYLVKTTYWTHRKHKDFKRKTVEVINWKNEVEPLGMMQYFFEDEPHNVSPKKHGNAKGGERFYPTSRSTKSNISKRVRSCQGPSKIYDQAFQDAGGMFAIKAVSDLPRNSRQVKYERSKLRQKNRQRRVGQFSREKSQQHVDSKHSVDSMPTSSYCIKGTPSRCCQQLLQSGKVWRILH